MTTRTTATTAHPHPGGPSSPSLAPSGKYDPRARFFPYRSPFQTQPGDDEVWLLFEQFTQPRLIREFGGSLRMNPGWDAFIAYLRKEVAVQTETTLGSLTRRRDQLRADLTGGPSSWHARR